jgi:beta-hydroxyacyl-ACP dehydratase FabZ
MTPEGHIVGLKNVTMNEPFFQGHFPGIPVMPGVLIIEAMAQVGGVWAYATQVTDMEKELIYFMGIDKARFRSPVVPGDQLLLELTLLRNRGKVFKMSGKATVDDHIVAEAEIMAMTGDKS